MSFKASDRRANSGTDLTNGETTIESLSSMSIQIFSKPSENRISDLRKVKVSGFTFLIPQPLTQAFSRL